ncbi:hypothetical protein ABZX40_26110 [Streptomyces sp. NPDC004610]|uniref:hypothetical protein n=1 Tax=unclassified Streptomyces TaxID=2593676 RepID=UPI0033BA6A95
MTSTTHDIPADVLTLLALPALAALTPDQERGAVCVWGRSEAPLTTMTAINLGEQQTDGRHWFPRACRPHTGAHAYRALMDHAPQCRPCIQDAIACPTGIALRRLMRAARRTV